MARVRKTVAVVMNHRAAVDYISRVVLQGFVLVFLLFINRIRASSFTFINDCEYTVWPGILANAGTEALSTTGFELKPGQTATVAAPAGWSGRFWGRTACTFDSEGKGTCGTGDCGGSLECNGMGAAPPATLAEFTLGRGSLQDFYDVSLVDGYNLPMLVTAKGGNGTCSATGCVTDLNLSCPKELQVDAVGDDGGARGSVACKSACEAFGTPEYCCSGAFGNADTCKPSNYSRLFKTACPRSYSYAYDDATSTFTCTGADYAVAFCPRVASQKKSKDSPSTTLDDNSWGISAAADAASGASGSGTRRASVVGPLIGIVLSLFHDTWRRLLVQ